MFGGLGWGNACILKVGEAGVWCFIVGRCLNVKGFDGLGWVKVCIQKVGEARVYLRKAGLGVKVREMRLHE